jgi:hypothetical protein
MPAGNAAQNFKKSDYERAANEWYVEPAWCVNAMANVIDLPGTIWDPACGMGTIPEVFRTRGKETWATDLIDRGYEAMHSAVDFLSIDPVRVRDLQPDLLPDRYSIVTNPPFNLAEAFVRHAMQMPNVQKVVIVQQLKFLASQRRWRLYHEFPPSEVLIMSKRPSMPPGHAIAEMGEKAFKGGEVDYCWIIWDVANPLDPWTEAPTLRWLNPGATV